MANTYNKRYPESTIVPEYYYTEIEETMGGHAIIKHNKPGEEAISIRHSAGSYIEIDKNSALRLTSVHKSYYYMADGFSHTVEGHSDVKVLGSHSFYADSTQDQIKNNKVLGVGGNYGETINGEHTSYTGGNRSIAVEKNDIHVVKGKTRHTYQDDAKILYNKNVVETIQNNLTTRVGGGIEIISAESVETTSVQGSATPGLIHMVCKNIVIEAESITLKTPQGLIKIDSNILMNALRIDLNP